MGIAETSAPRRALAVVAERDDEAAEPGAGGTVGKGSSAPSGPPPAAQPEPNAQRGCPSQYPSCH